jgi:oligosaccharide 4-alpha-D-glucosyltransferase
MVVLESKFMNNPSQWLARFAFIVALLNCFISTQLKASGPDSGVRALQYVDHQINQSSLSIRAQDRIIKITPRANGSIEVYHLKNAQKIFPSFATKESLLAVTENVNFKESESQLVVLNGKLKAVVNKNDLSITFYWKTELLTKQFSAERGSIPSGFSFSLSKDEKVLGGGERVLGMDRRGHRMPLYNRAHYGYTTESNQMYYGLPLVFSSKKYAVLYDNSASGHLDIGKTKSAELVFESVGGRQSYMIFAADNYPELIHRYVTVTGTQPLPPRWAFGNFASRFGYKTEQQVRDVVERFEKEAIPLDSVIIDLYWFGNDIKGFMGNLEWDREAFPEPEKMIRDLKQKGIQTILITEPFILSSSTKWQQAVDAEVLAKDNHGKPKRFDFYFGNTGLIDVFDSNAQKWFGRTYSQLTKQGVAGVWGDLGEPEVHPDDSVHYLSDSKLTARGDEIHNVYGHQWAKMVYQNLINDQPTKRPFIMMRSGFAGSQRYGMIPWTGDVSRSWDGLKPQVELSLQMGLSGLAYTHSDLGGFAGGDVFDKELYIRWLQYGVFQPVFRPHAQDNIAPEPVFHDTQTKTIIGEYIKLRYRLLPYIYTMAYDNSTKGLPLMRPMFFDDESNLERYDVDHQYYWGDSFLVSPITESKVTTQKIQLPSGVWFDFWNDRPYNGDQTINYPIDLDRLPVLVKAGSFIPMVNTVQTTRDYSSEELTLHYYADPSIKTANGKMYEDDGVSANSIQNQAFELIRFNAKHTNKITNELMITLQRESKGYPGMPNRRVINLDIHNWQSQPNRVKFNGKNVDSDFWNYNEITKRMVVNLSWDHQPIDISIE